MKEQQPAFPGRQMVGDWMGLSKREYIAIKAMQGMIAANSHPEARGYGLDVNSLIPKLAFEYADAMIAFEEKEGKECLKT